MNSKQLLIFFLLLFLCVQLLHATHKNSLDPNDEDNDGFHLIPDDKIQQQQKGGETPDTTQIDNNPVTSSPPPKVLDKPKFSVLRPYVWGSSGLIVLAAVGAITLRIGRPWWQRYQINKVLKKYNKNLKTVTPMQRELLKAAFCKDPAGIKKCLRKRDMSELKENAWILLAVRALYYERQRS